MCIFNILPLDLELKVKLECNHEFHKACLENVEKSKCPLCGKPLKYKKPEIVKEHFSFIFSDVNEKNYDTMFDYLK